MNTYTNDYIREEKPSKCVIREDGGYEITSNDGEMLIILTKTCIFSGTMEQEYHRSRYFLKEGDGWEESNGGSLYHSADEFFSAIRQSENFTQALNEYDKGTDNNYL